jgi:hypothetical protein
MAKKWLKRNGQNLKIAGIRSLQKKDFGLILWVCLPFRPPYSRTPGIVRHTTTSGVTFIERLGCLVPLLKLFSEIISARLRLVHHIEG